MVQLNDTILVSFQSSCVADEKLATATEPLEYNNEVAAEPKSAMSWYCTE